MRILVLVQSYPTEQNPYAMSYVHSRNMEYLNQGYEVSVINFSTLNKYVYENINVYPYDARFLEENDIILAHAPNIKNHFKYLRNLKNKKICFFFHGHEVLKQYGDYPPPYKWNDKSIIKKIPIQIYDVLKLKLLNKFLLSIGKNNSVGLIFISEWMQKQFIKNLNIQPQFIGKVSIINNSCNQVFLQSSYEPDVNKKADFITIRPLDESKYAIDLVVNLALNNPLRTFHIYGTGSYFRFNSKPNNLVVINKFVKQKDIPDLLNHYNCALMPTRYDAQGVTTCEMATYGIPLITSNIEISVEMLKEFENVSFLNESEFKSLDLDKFIPKLSKHKNLKFDTKRLVKKELDFFAQL